MWLFLPLGAPWEGLSPCGSGVGSGPDPKGFKRSLCYYFQGELTAAWGLQGIPHTKKAFLNWEFVDVCKMT